MIALPRQPSLKNKYLRFILCAGLLFSSLAIAYETENVFLVVYDGLRNNEGFEAGNKYLRFVVDSLMPKATVYTNFWNTGITVTNAAHSTIATGVRQILRNNAYLTTQVRPREPTVAEYYRKHLGVAQNKVFFVSGKNAIWKYPVSVYPGYGYEYGPTIVLTSEADAETWDMVRSLIDQYHPSMCYVLFAQIDGGGHSGDTTQYFGAIRQADSLTFELWKLIQSDSIYQNKTTMIVTADHGRDDDMHGGWASHGCDCHGCRNLPFLAIGPDIKQDTVINLERDQIDIVPTIGHLLGFPTPLAQGEVMTEMIKDYRAPGSLTPQTNASNEINISNSVGYSHSCDIAVDPVGIHIVYADNTSGRYEILYSRSTDQGATWSLPQSILTAPLSEYLEPAIASFGNSGLYVAAANYFFQTPDSSYTWSIRGRRSTNSGETWEQETFIDSSFGMSCRPAICATGNRIQVVSMKYVVIVSNLSRNGGLSFEPLTKVCPLMGTHPHSPTATFIDTTCCVAWQQICASLPYHEIWFDVEPWANTRTVTSNTVNSYSYEPSITSDQNNVLHLAYAQLPNDLAGNDWQIYYQQSTNLGATWTAMASISQTHIGMEPVIKAADNGTIFCVWSDYTDHQWKICGSHSTDHGVTWRMPYEVTTMHAYAIEPGLAISNETLFVAWREYRDNNWEVCFKSFALAGIYEEDESNFAYQRLTLIVNPNPFRDAVNIVAVLPSDFQPSSNLNLKIFDVSGRLVRQFNPQDIMLSSSIIWDAKDMNNRGVNSGVYFCKLSCGSDVEIKKIILTE